MNLISCHKLLITVVQKGKAKKVVEATRRAGAEGGTIFLGKGTGIYEKKFFGIPVNQDKEIVLTLFNQNIIEPIFNEVAAAGKLLETGQGIAFVIDVPYLIGIVHYCELDSLEREAMNQQSGYELVITVVNKGNAETVVAASKRAGAEGGTILFGRGTGIHEQAKLFSIPIEPEKEVVLTLIARNKTEAVLQAIREDSCLDQPGKGIAFVLPVERTTGIKRLEP
ncbi:MAG TPA: PII family protein [Desulfurivibrio alkaliphilus]|uniref:PII family protein n=1 Tax=Desulfurivibrio alkaliphilus TaxID=427923 RepID=A0A7C2XGL5_9BACT|nr:PII family protein [Desulfurivibrio alkaliphilus]